MKKTEFKQAWYVAHTKSRFENVATTGLSRKRLSVFLPKIRVRSKRQDRKLMIDVPLFPGYIFVRTDLNPDEHLEILKTTGVVRLVGNKSGPTPVPEECIESLKIMIAQNGVIETGTHFQKGDKVIVTGGPFRGVVGIFVRYQKKERVLVQIEALGQYASVEVDTDDVEPISDDTEFT